MSIYGDGSYTEVFPKLWVGTSLDMHLGSQEMYKLQKCVENKNECNENM